MTQAEQPFRFDDRRRVAPELQHAVPESSEVSVDALSPALAYELAERDARRRAEIVWLAGRSRFSLSVSEEKKLLADVEGEVSVWRLFHPRPVPPPEPTPEERALRRLADEAAQRAQAEQLAERKIEERDRKMGLLRPLLIERPDLDLSSVDGIPWFDLGPHLANANIYPSELSDWVRDAASGEPYATSFFGGIAAELEAKREAERERQRRADEALERTMARYRELCEARNSAKSEAARLQEAWERAPSRDAYLDYIVAEQVSKNAHAAALEFFERRGLSKWILAPGDRQEAACLHYSTV